MSFAPTLDTFRVSAINLCGALSLPDPIGGSVDTLIGWIKSRPGTRVSPATAPDSYDCSAVGICQTPFTPVAVGTKGTTTFTLEKISGATFALALTGMLAGAYKARMSQKPHEFEQGCEYDAADTENLANISVS